MGKSVAAKRLIARLCADSRFVAAQLIYFSADGFRAQDLRRAFVLGTDLTNSAGRLPRVWVVDEVATVPGWAPLIKELRDNTQLAQDAVVLTSSSAVDLDTARRALGAGRTGVANPFRLLLPMTFRSFVTVTAVDVPLPDPVSIDSMQSPSANETIRGLEPFVDDLDLAWQRFLECGGFPRAVGEYHRLSTVSPEFIFDLLSWLGADVDPAVPLESIPRLLAELGARTGSPLAVASVAAKLGMSRERLTVRLARLVSAFASMWCRQLDANGTPVEGSQSKLYLLDPLIAHLPRLRDEAFPEPDMTRLNEQQLALEIARAVDRLHPDRLIEQRAVGYTRIGAGNEIDFAPVPVHVSGNERQSVPVEAKWVSQGWRRESLGMRRRYGAGVVATKNIVDIDDAVWAVPAPIVSLLLN